MGEHLRYSDEEIARAWVRHFSQNGPRILLPGDPDIKVHEGQRIKAETEWAFDELERLIERDPTRTWAVIRCILELGSQDEKVLDDLAAGPLETLLARHGRDVIEWIEAEAKSNPKFRDLLKGVWGNAIDESVWTRVQSLVND